MPKAKTPEQKKADAEAKAAARVVKEDMQTGSTSVDEASIPTDPVEAAPEPERVVKTDLAPVQNDNPQPNNGNAMAVNKPLAEYNTSDGEPIRRAATPEEVAANKVDDEEPRRLIVGDGPGNLMIIKWDRGGGRVPKNCEGGWNNKQRALEAIKAARQTPEFHETQAE